MDTQTGNQKFIMRAGVASLAMSPRDSYLVTCEKYQQGYKNLVVWDCKGCKELAEFESKKTSKEGTKSFKFGSDERFAARLVSKTQIEIFEGGNFKEPKVRINATAELLAKKNSKLPD